jgi:small conductance mechanosensitive channel
MDANSVTGTINQVVEASAALVSTWGIRVLGAIVVLIVGRWIAGVIRRGVHAGLERGRVDGALIPFVSSAAYYLVLAIVIISVLNLFGIETTSLIAVLGAAGLAIGLALQGTLSNFAAGTMLLLFRPFRPGDYVEVAGQSGGVAEIGIFTTTLNTPDNVRITIPNSAVYGSVIKNYAVNGTRRVDMVMAIAYADDVGRAIDTITRVVRNDKRVLNDPELVVAVGELTDSAVNIVVRPWCNVDDYLSLKFDLTRELKQALEAAGCSIPFPQRVVHVTRDGEAAA